MVENVHSSAARKVVLIGANGSSAVVEGERNAK